jgi:hypothetical protein
VTTVHDHGDAERAQLRCVSGLRDMHAPDRHRVPRRTRPVHPHRHFRPGRRGQRDLPIDPGRPTPGVALGNLTDADQRVRPGPQHHLLQGPDGSPILLPCRLEDPAPQPHYVLLMSTPVNGVPVQDVLGSVHRDGVQLAPRFGQALGLGVQRLTCPRQRPFGPGRASGIRPVPRNDHLEGRPAVTSPVAFRPPASACWASCPAEGFRPSHDRPTRPPRSGPRRGFHVPRTRDTTGVGAPYTPGPAVFTRPATGPPVAACRLFQQPGPTTLVFVPPAKAQDHEVSVGIHLCSPVRSSPCPVVPPDGTGALGRLP